MNCPRTPLALAILWPVVLLAAEAPPATDRPFESARQDLGALKSAPPGAIPGQGLDLGAVAGGISGAGSFAAPPVSAPPRQPESGAATQQPKSSGWLLDALEENSRRAGAGIARSDGRADSAGDEESDARAKSGNTAQDSAAKKPASTLPSAVNSPLSGYMSAWLSPDEFRRLGSLYPELTGGGAQPDALADPSNLRRLDGMAPNATNGSTPQQGAPVAPGSPGSVRVADNPFVQAMQAGPRPALPAPSGGTQRPTATPAPSLAAPVPEAIRPPAAAPETPGADDRRYFPQLKRF